MGLSLVERLILQQIEISMRRARGRDLPDIRAGCHPKRKRWAKWARRRAKKPALESEPASAPEKPEGWTRGPDGVLRWEG